MLESCLGALERCRERVPLDAVVVASRGDAAVQDLSRWSWVEVIAASEDARFTHAANVGFAHARGDTILLLDPACRVSPDALERLVRALRSEPGVAAVAPALLDSLGLPQRSCGRLPGLWSLACDHLGLAAALPEWGLFGGYTYGGRRLETLEHVGWASSAALLVPRVVWEKVGGFDERIVVCMEDRAPCALRAGRARAVRRRGRRSGRGVSPQPALARLLLPQAPRRRRGTRRQGHPVGEPGAQVGRRIAATAPRARAALRRGARHGVGGGMAMTGREAG